MQNRVDPFGAIVRSAARGTMMGNRGGALHDERREIVRPFKGIRWIACLLEFKGRQRSVMSPGLYTELFFLDEAVGLSAGHRPCAECRRDRFNAFRAAWALGHDASPERLRAPAIDRELHRCRVDPSGGKVTYEAPLELLPDGCFVAIDGAAYLLWKGALALWTPEGYARSERPLTGLKVTVLTPRPTVECLVHGYEPEIHGSLSSL